MAATKETTAVDVGALLDDGDDAVVSLVAGETRLVAHRAVLSARSAVFSAMFQKDTVEASGGEVTVQDVEGPVLRQMVSYLYTLRLPQLKDMTPQLLEAANKYGVAGLKAACEQQVSIEAADAAVRDSCTDLSKAAIKFIMANLQVMAAALLNQPKDVVEVSPLLADPPAETSTPPPADSGTSHQPSTQSHSGDRSRHSGTPASATPAAVTALHIPPPDDAYVSQLRSLPAEVKNWRLREVAGEGAVAELDALLAAGADVAATDKQKWTALHWAVREGHVEAARLLIARGAPVNAINSLKRTPLYHAACHGHVAVVRLLLAASADHYIGDVYGHTALHIAKQNNHKQVVDLLSER